MPKVGHYYFDIYLQYIINLYGACFLYRYDLQNLLRGGGGGGGGGWSGERSTSVKLVEST